MFLLKKIISSFLMPIPLILEFFAIGLLFFRYSRFKKTGTGLKVFSVILFLAVGYGIGDGYLYDLERRYPTFNLTTEQCEPLKGAVVVVLGQGLPTDSDLPLRYRENRVFILRLLEGIRVAKCISESILIVSMAGNAMENDKRAFLDDLSTFLTFPSDRVSMITTARDTREEVALVRSVINNRGSNSQPAIIVATSASHIPRSILLFQKAGFSPIAAPCDYQISEKNGWLDISRMNILGRRRWINAETTFHEGIGLIYTSIFIKSSS